MKKILALLLVLSLLAGALLCFASCDGNKDTGDNGNDTEQGDNSGDNGNTGDNTGNNGDTGENGGNAGGEENTEPDLTDDTYPEDVANDIF